MMRMLSGWLSVVLVFGYSADDPETTVSPSICETLIFKYNGRQQSTFYTPVFPHAYPANVHCLLYTFIGDVSQIVELTFLEFDLKLPVANKCSDFLRLYLDLETTTLVNNPSWNYELCGNISTIPKQHYSSCNVLILEFHSGHVLGNNTGFRGIYKFVDKAQFQLQGGSQRWGSKCTFHFQSNKLNRAGRFFSPRYPQNYPANTFCQYIFSAMRNERIAVVFQNIQLEVVNGSCSSSPDTIVVRDGPDNVSPVIARYCNTLNAEAVLSSGENLFVEMVSDGQNQRQGFAAVFDFIHEDQLRSGTSNGNPHSTRLASHVRPGSITHNPGDSPFLEMQANEGNSTTPDYKKPIRPISCDREFVSSQLKDDNFTSPFYPNPYPEGAVCRYSFQGQGRERVQIIFTDFDLFLPQQGDSKEPIECEPIESIDVVRVTILVGGSPSVIGLFCGSWRPPKLMSADNRMEITFISRQRSSSGNNKSRGFRVSYVFVQDFGIKTGEQDTEMVCGFIFRSTGVPNGTFTSPNFPGLYPRNTECHYLFYGGENEIVYITFINFDVEGMQPGCLDDTQSDFVEFSNFNILLTDRKMIRFCGNSEERTKRIVKSDANFFRVSFKSNDIYDAVGFEAFYQFRKVDDNFTHQKIRSASNTISQDLSLLMLSAVAFLATLITRFSQTIFSWASANSSTPSSYSSSRSSIFSTYSSSCSSYMRPASSASSSAASSTPLKSSSSSASYSSTHGDSSSLEFKPPSPSSSNTSSSSFCSSSVALFFFTYSPSSLSAFLPYSSFISFSCDLSSSSTSSSFNCSLVCFCIPTSFLFSLFSYFFCSSSFFSCADSEASFNFSSHFSSPSCPHSSFLCLLPPKPDSIDYSSCSINSVYIVSSSSLSIKGATSSTSSSSSHSDPCTINFTSFFRSPSSSRLISSPSLISLPKFSAAHQILSPLTSSFFPFLASSISSDTVSHPKTFSASSSCSSYSILSYFPLVFVFNYLQSLIVLFQIKRHLFSNIFPFVLLLFLLLPLLQC